MAEQVVVDSFIDLEDPAFSCAECHFSSVVAGKWSVEDGRLVFRADADPQPRRGPDLEYCGEGYGPIANFSAIHTHWGSGRIDGEDFAALQATAREAREQEFNEG